VTACDFAACSRPATATAAGWAFCAPHLTEHRAEFDPAYARRGQTLRERVADLHADGYLDTEIARLVGMCHTTVRYHRNAMGLPALSRGGPPATVPCGTLSAARRHYRRGEPLCQSCREARNAAQRKGAYPPVRTGNRWVGA
jgi:hypothetical protein